MPKVVKCRNCFEFQMSNANKIFKCIKCQKSMQLHMLKIYFESDSPQLCTKVVQQLKEEYFRVNGKYGEDDFFSYEVEK